VRELTHDFEHSDLIQINWSLNQHADALSKLVAAKDTLGRLIHMEVLQKPSLGEKEEIEGIHFLAIQEDWRTMILKYLLNQELPDSPSEAK